MNIRKLAYTVVSEVQRTPVRKFINEFKYTQSKKELLASSRLKSILNHAKVKTDFYKNYNAFEDFPIISKKILRDNYDDFLSYDIDKKNSVKTTTSGSSGRPMTFYLSKEKKYRQNAEVIFYNRWANIDVGDNHAYVRVTNLKSQLKLFIQNEVLMNPKSLNADWLEHQVNILRRRKINSIIGYPSAIAAIARKANELGLEKADFQIKGVLTSGENLRAEDQEDIRSSFGVKPLSRYSTEEFGVIATSCPHCNKFHVNDTGYIVEILELNSDKHVLPGKQGRVIITDLFSYNMPLIRFDTEDIAVYSGKSECSFYSTGITLEYIVGRQIETVFNIQGEAISPFSINGALRDLHSVMQFQFIQNALDDNTLLLVVNDNFTNKDKVLISMRLKGILNTETTIKTVNEITAKKSGKRPYIISNLKV